MERTKEFRLIIERFRTKSQVLGFNKKITTSTNSIVSSDVLSFKNSTFKLLQVLTEIEIKLKQMDEYIRMLREQKSTMDYSIVDQLSEVIRYDISSITGIFSEMNEKLKFVTSGSLSKLPQSRTHFLSISIFIQKKLQNLSKQFKDNCKIKEDIIRHYQFLPELLENSNKKNEMPNNLYQYPQSNYSSLLSPPPVQQTQQLMTAQRENELRQRDTSVREVEATIVRLGDMFDQFSCVVQEQEELVENIANNSSSALFDIDEAHSQLTKYLGVIRNNRNLMLKFFLVLIVFIFLFTYFM